MNEYEEKMLELARENWDDVSRVIRNIGDFSLIVKLLREKHKEASFLQGEEALKPATASSMAHRWVYKFLDKGGNPSFQIKNKTRRLDFFRAHKDAPCRKCKHCDGSFGCMLRNEKPGEVKQWNDNLLGRHQFYNGGDCPFLEIGVFSLY